MPVQYVYIAIFLIVMAVFAWTLATTPRQHKKEAVKPAGHSEPRRRAAE